MVVERLLLTLADAEDSETQREFRRDSPTLVNNEDSSTWPPSPWPPWDENDGDDDEDDGSGKPINKTLRVHNLAKNVVKFERKLAQASLDLYIFNFSTPTYGAHWYPQRHFVSRSNCNVQSC